MPHAQETLFYLWDTDDGKVAVEPAMPSIEMHVWPLQTLRAVGTGTISPPLSPMSMEEFNEWRKGLAEVGFSVEIRFQALHRRGEAVRQT